MKRGIRAAAPLILLLDQTSARRVEYTNDRRPNQSSECQMSKRKPATKSKHSRGPKITAQAHRVAQDVVRSPKDNRLPSVGAASTESHPERHNEEEALVADPMTAFQAGNRHTRSAQ